MAVRGSHPVSHRAFSRDPIPGPYQSPASPATTSKQTLVTRSHLQYRPACALRYRFLQDSYQFTEPNLWFAARRADLNHQNTASGQQIASM
jgi:hypothetical protein